MSQHDFNIANQTFPNFRADLNNALVAAATMSAGSSAPTTPYAYQLWFDTTTGTWKVRNSGNTAWVSTITTDLATGNVGIGTSSPDYNLVVKGSANTNANILAVKDSDNTKMMSVEQTSNGDGRLFVYDTAGNADILLHTNGNSYFNGGNVGIGASSVAHKLTVNASAFDGIQLQSGGSDCGYLGVSTDTVYVGAGSNLVFHTGNSGLTNGSERMRLTADGNVGIGTATPIALLTMVAADGVMTDQYVAKFTNSETTTGQNYGVFIAGGSSSADESFGVRNFDSSATYFKVRGDGNVGIGTTSPAYTLQVGEGNGQMSLGNATAGNGSSRLKFLSSNSQKNWQISTNDNVSGALEFTQTTAGGGTTFASSPAMLIHNSGALLVNTTSRSGTSNFVVAADTNVANPMSVVNTKTGVGTEYAILFYRAGSIVGSIQTSLTATSYISPSDYRLKTAVNYDWDATSRLKQLKPARFEWIVDGDDAVPVDGFLAHEVSHDSEGNPLVPEAITGTKDGMMDEEYEVSAATGDIYTPAVEATYDDDGVELTAAVDEVIHSTDVERPEELAEGQQWRETTAAVMGTRSVPDYQGIDQSKLVPLLVKTIQELEARITALEAS